MPCGCNHITFIRPILKSTNHFRTPIQVGLDIMDKLRGRTSGLAIPYFVIDAPGGGGKIPILPNYVVSHDEKNWVLRNYKYDIYTYPDVVEEEKPTKAPARKRPVRAPRKKKVFNQSEPGPGLR